MSAYSLELDGHWRWGSRMCGIGGSVSREENAFAGKLADQLAHRGPDHSDSRFTVTDRYRCHLVHTRLSIVDLSPDGNEPMSNEDETLWMVFNGEIYNFPELRAWCESKGHRFKSRCDAEVILHLWEMEGRKCLPRLNGIFALAISDERAGKVWLARDPMGVKPLFYVHDSDALIFASELSALRATGVDMGRPDLLALAQFLTFLWIPNPRTPFSKALALSPGCVLEWDNGTTSVRRFRNPIADASVRPTLGVPTVTEAAQRVREAVHRQLLSDVPIGLLASGGVDSSLIWWAASGGVARCFTIDWSGDSSDERNDEDANAVRTLEAAMHTPVDYLPGVETDIGVLPRSGDLFADPAFELTRRISSHARSLGIKVLLSGQGGDELFGGYRRHQMAELVGRLRTGRIGRVAATMLANRRRPDIRTEYVARIARASAQSSPLHSYLELCSYSTAVDRARVLGCTTAEVDDAAVWQEHERVYETLPRSWSLLRRMRAVDIEVYLPGLGLAYMDRAGMANGVEIRVPWLDLELVDWALCLPDRALIRGSTSKWLVRQLAEQELSREIAHRPKRGFGVPSGMLPAASGVGERGFRQSRYLAIAQSLISDYWAS